MRAVAHGWKPDRIKGPPRKVAKEFVAADKRAKGMQMGGMASSGKMIKKLMKKAGAGDTRTDEERMRDRYGTEPLSPDEARKKGGLDALKQMQKHGWTQLGKKWIPPQKTLTAPGEGASAAGVTRPWERGEGPLWDETIYAMQGKNRELVGPRTVTSPAVDPSQYLIHLNPVGEDFEGEVDTSGYWGHRLDAARIAELEEQGYTAMTGRDSGYWTPPTGRAWDPSSWAVEEDVPPRETQPIPGGGLIDELPPAAPARRAAADIAPGFRPGRVPPSLLRYLEKSRAAAGEPVKMQGGGMMNFLFKGQGPMPQVPGGGFTGGGFGGKGPGNWMTQGRVPPQGGGGVTSDQGMQKFLQRGQVPGGGGMNSLLQQIQQRRQAPGGGVGQGQPRPQPPGGGLYGPGRGQSTRPAPGAGVPMRGVGRPPGMGRPGAGSGYESNQPIRNPGSSQDEMRAYRAKRAAMGQGPGGGRAGIGMGMPGGGGPGGVRPAVMPGRGFMPTPGPTGGGGAGTPGGTNRIGMGDQQGALARASQVQTGRPPISRRQPFPGRGGPGGGFGRSRRRRGRGRMRR